MTLFHRKFGNGPAMIILHGLYGSSDNWYSVAKILGEKYEVFVPDQRNHGQSSHSDEFSYALLAEDLKNFMDEQSIEKAIIVGHSMGGKAAMNFALKYPEKINALIIVDISPRNYREHRNFNMLAGHHRDILNAMTEMDLASLKSREEAEKIMFKKFPDERLTNFLLKNLKRTREGNFYWALNIDSISKNMEEILSGFSEEEIKSKTGITGFPVLFMKGELSSYLNKEDFEFIEKIFPATHLETIKDAGHWMHAEQQDAFIKAILDFTM